MLPVFVALALILGPMEPAVPPLKTLPTPPPVSDYPHDEYGTEYPPLGYSYFPKRPVLRIEVPLFEVNRNCFYAPVGFFMFACTKPTPSWIKPLLINPNLSQADHNKLKASFKAHPDLCVIIMPKVDQVMTFGHQWSIWNHELAHCNGLVHDGTAHGWFLPDGTPVK